MPVPERPLNNGQIYLWQLEGPDQYFVNHFVSIFRLLRKHGRPGHTIILRCALPTGWEFIQSITWKSVLELRNTECGRPDDPRAGVPVMRIYNIRPTSQWINKLTILNPEDVQPVLVHLQATCQVAHLIAVED